MLKINSLEKYEQEQSKRGEKRLRNARIFHAVSFLLVLLTFGVLSFVLPKPVESAVENRKLAAMPEFSVEALFKGTFIKDVEAHYSDTFPLREELVSLAAVVNEARGIRFDGVRIYNQAPEPAQPAPLQPTPPASSAPITAKPQSSSEATPPESEAQEVLEEEHHPHVVEDDGALGEKSGSVFVYKGKALSLFGGSNEMGQWYANTLNAYRAAWGGEVSVYNLVIPSAIEFALPERYKSVTMPQKPIIDFIYSQLDEGIIAVDAYSAIENHADEYLYFNADHHWTGRGAYYAYTAFAKAAGLVPLLLEDYEIREIPDFYGTLFSSTADSSLKKDSVEYFIMPTEHKTFRYDKGAPFIQREHSVWAEYAKSPNTYSVFLHGDFPLIRIDTENQSGRRALVVKESFGNAFAPFLISHFDQVFVVDQRYFQLGLVDFVNQNGVTDVIFINNSFAANTGIRIQEISNLMYQQFKPPAPTPAPESQPESEQETAAQGAAEG